MHEIMPEQVETMLPIWHARALRWRNLLIKTAKERNLRLGAMSLYPVAYEAADGVQFTGKTLDWIEKDYDGILDRLEVPYAVLRSDDAGEMWVRDWVEVELKKAQDAALLDRERKMQAARRLEDVERAQYLRLKAKYESTKGAVDDEC